MALTPLGNPALPRTHGAAARLLPVVSTLAAAVISLLPVPIPGYLALTPAFTLMAVYHWTIYRPDLLPPGALFAIGVLQDLLSGALPGVSALLLLAVRAVMLNSRRHFVNRPFAYVWAGFALLAAGAMLGLWLLHCLLDGLMLDVRSATFRAVLTISLFPAASFLLGRAQRALMAAR